MSEIICSYTINQQTEESFFVTDTRVSFSQFTQFIQNNIFAEDFTIKDAKNETIRNDDQLKALLHTAVQSGILSINIVSLKQEEEINATESVPQRMQEGAQVEQQHVLSQRKAAEEAERLAKEEAERNAAEEASRLAKEEEERKAAEEAERLAKEEEERKVHYKLLNR